MTPAPARRFPPRPGLPKIIVLLLLAGLSACVPARRVPTERPGEEPAAIPPPVPRGGVAGIPTAGGGASVIWFMDAKDDLLSAAEFLRAHPNLKITLFMHDRPASQAERRAQAFPILSTVTARGQVEWGLKFPGHVPLALAADTDIVKLSTAPVAAPPRYSWPDDVPRALAYHLAAFKRRFKSDPAAVVLPANVLTGADAEALERIRIERVVVPQGPVPEGVYDAEDILVFRPAGLPVGTDKERKDWLTRWAFGDAGAPAAGAPPAVRVPLALYSFDEVKFFAAWALAASEPALDENYGGVLLSEAFPEGVDWPEWPGLQNPGIDFSRWAGNADQNMAWRLLGMTREAVEAYKNSGAADEKKLDLALREIYSVENGPYFEILGRADLSPAQKADGKQELLASLAQVYRLMGQSVPDALLKGFPSSLNEIQSSGQQGDTRFERAGQVLRWIDAAGDDRGPGDYFYPTGGDFPSGSWDVRVFEVDPEETNVVFRFEFGALPNPWNGPKGFSLPLVDVYIDINHIPGAGAQTLLPGRPGNVETQDSWEYTIVIDGWGGRLYQFSPSGTPRRIADVQVRRENDTRIAAEVPRRFLRGEPERWGYAVCVMGKDVSGAEGYGRPMKVQSEPGPRHFGGASRAPDAKTLIEAPPYIDIVAPPGGGQIQILGAYKTGREMALPFLRAE